MSASAYKDFLLEHLDFAIEYISLHYPFTESEVIEYLPFLIKGDAYYPVYMQDCEQIFRPQMGLAFNQNIQWTDELKRMWRIGIWEPFTGQYDGQGELPMDVHEVIARLDSLGFQQAYSLYSGEEGFENLVPQTPDWLLTMVDYGTLSPKEVAELIDRSKTEVLINPSIWHNTFKEVITSEVVSALIQARKQQIEAEQTDLKDDGRSPLTPAEEATLYGQPVLQPIIHVTFPDFHEFMEQIPADHEKDPCFGAFNLYEALFGGSDINAALDGYARKWETSHKKILAHMECVHDFLEAKHPNVLRIIEANQTVEEDEDSEDEDDIFDDDYPDKRPYSKYKGYNDWPDDAIDEAFEGDPESTWNVD